MQKQKGYAISLFTIMCILINVAGKLLAARLGLPVWLDSFGTVLAAYVNGPVCGAIVGMSVNIICNFAGPRHMIYALTSILIGVITGILARRKMLESLYGLLSSGFLLAVVSIIVSTPLNYIFFNGNTGNAWGDGVIAMLKDYGVNSVLSCIIGEYYVDFIDKLITLVALYLLIRLVRHLRSNESGGGRMAVFFLMLFAGGLFASQINVQAAGIGQTDYVDWMQTVYDAKNGLPGGAVNDIAQTGDGILWVGTYGGMYRCNGNDFYLMSEFDSVKNVNCFYTDSEGRLWIGTNDNGLSICINNEIVNVIDEESGLPSNSVRCIKEGADGNFYVGTTGSLAIVNLSSGLTVVDVIPDITYARSVTTGADGYTAVVANDGTLFILKESKIISKKTYDGKGEVFTCATFIEDVLYAGTSGSNLVKYGVNEGVLAEQERVHCSGVTQINSIKQGPQGYVFICADNGAGYFNSAAQFKKINTGAFNSSIDNVILDYQGNLWFTSSRLGLLKLCETPFTDIYGKLGFRENVVNAVTKWQDNFYFGTDNGLDMANGKLTRKITNSLTESLNGVRIRSFMVDSDDTLWICTSGMGVWHVAKNEEVTVYDSGRGMLGDKFRCAIEMKDKTLVFAGDTGLTFIKNGVITHTIGNSNGLDNPKVLCLFERADGALLAGTDGNGIALIEDGKVVRTFRKEDGLSSKVILRMVADGDRGIYIVTGNSLCYMDGLASIHVLSDFPYFNNFDVIAGPDGNLFVTGSAGIYVVNRDSLLENHSPEYILLDYAVGLRDSLTANSWNYVDDNNNLYLAGDTGVTVVDMKNYNAGRRSYRMNIKYMQVDDDTYFARLGETVTVPKNAARIVIAPEVVNYSTSNPYVSYYLEGFDTAPKVFLLNEINEAVYTNLPSGTYNFHLSVLDEEGNVASENTCKIVKEANVYDGRLFKVYVGFVFVLTIVYLTWMLFRTQIQKTLMIQKRELELARKQVQMSNEAILAVAKAVDAKDVNTSEHSYRVSEYAHKIAERLGFTEEECETLRQTALVHDIGKIGIPDSVLNKPGKLTKEEYDVMKSHVTKGAEILKHFSSMEHIVEGAQYHHERYDGTGYAEGLKGEEIPLYARIIGIADAFDAMTANRIYRKRLDFSYVLNELKKGRGTQFDPKLVDIMLSLIEDGTVDVSKLYEDMDAERRDADEEDL